MIAPTHRCEWALTGGPAIGDAYVRYHDEVWGVPERDARVLFEFLILEGAQAGLSWSTILRKLDGYRRAYDGFDPAVIADYGDRDVARLLADEGIVRNRAKVAASIRNARAWLELDDPASYLWGFTGGEVMQNAWPDMAAVPAQTDRSQAMSRDLKRRGFTFVGPTICYAFMQATGMVNDHVVTCFRHRDCGELA
ncbi:MAG TPA: DNA-3-methyladenine glycosylase I [Ilumatobacteraceae bacterium]|nr:DNA-3-methyladenine glycosylase I [Ilumatobacteraceae bacterium]